jgi:3-methyladenine DNA glycosylase AlkD
MNERTREARRELNSYADRERALNLQRFFKTGPGEYGEGDRFLGIRVPYIRKTVRSFRGMSIRDVLPLLHSEWHEERLFALLLMVDRFRKAAVDEKRDIYGLYMKSSDLVNNWDLVDLSAPHIPGAWLYTRDREPLFQFADSNHLWRKRISIIATQHFIRKNDFGDTLAISALLMDDEHDLIHKAVGWMLREVGKRDMGVEEEFLKEHYRRMPRTMLRYAIEKFPRERRSMYLNGEV